MEFYLKVIGAVLISALVFRLLMKEQARKQKEADIKFEQTLLMIELRNKTYDKNNR